MSLVIAVKEEENVIITNEKTGEKLVMFWRKNTGNQIRMYFQDDDKNFKIDRLNWLLKEQERFINGNQ
jgi:hypothetical protein